MSNKYYLLTYVFSTSMPYTHSATLLHMADRRPQTAAA